MKQLLLVLLLVGALSLGLWSYYDAQLFETVSRNWLEPNQLQTITFSVARRDGCNWLTIVEAEQHVFKYPNEAGYGLTFSDVDTGMVYSVILQAAEYGVMDLQAFVRQTPMGGRECE